MMEKKTTGTSTHKTQDERNANSAYSGSGAVQPGRSTGEPGKLSDYPEGNTEDDIESIQGKQRGKPDTDGKSIGEATDPSKLSDL